ncbi:hypothetical protein Phi10:1_gp068 [Cellulophaga phage phi10:1]|uniref:Uncharacterized protein n=1 Tax=Cellulophaga phage phi10:1 TaxID=1327981 RepID=R9ZYI5_9CAUD|nr:hypothetical protein Phi10:1_gp068 [Cellulophaga phage phi10:1]AGO48409.1 hypothetical protein Phi10:1_gp068 [Cellulophaga phage phi10:1]
MCCCSELFRRFAVLITKTNIMFIEMPDFQKRIYYLGIPYIVESSYRGRFFNALTIDEEFICFELEGKILNKYFLLTN